MIQWNYPPYEALLTVLCARNFSTIQQVLILKFAFGTERLPGLSRNGPLISYISGLKQRRRRWQREQQTTNRFRLTKQQLCTCITLFCTFLCRRCPTTTWKCLNSRFVEDGNTRQQLSFSFPELWCSLLEFSSRNNCQHLTNWTSWNKRDKVWSSANSYFNRLFLSRRRRCWLAPYFTHRLGLFGVGKHPKRFTSLVSFLVREKPLPPPVIRPPYQPHH